MRRRWMTVAIAFTTVVAIDAQSVQTPPEPSAAFEVASILLNVGGGFGAIRRLQGGRLEAVNVRLRELIESAYGLERPQTVEGSSPLLNQRFDVTAVGGKDWPTGGR